MSRLERLHGLVVWVAPFEHSTCRLERLQDLFVFVVVWKYLLFVTPRLPFSIAHFQLGLQPMYTKQP